MATLAIVLNGLPGSGKTTLAAPLAAALDIPLLSRDAIKEALADTVGVPLPTSGLGAVASETMWRIGALVKGPVIFESFWLRGRDDEYLASGLSIAMVHDGLELWCQADLNTTRQRFRTRVRHHAHDDSGRSDDWEEFARTASPLSPFPGLVVDTNVTVDVAQLVDQIKDLLPL